MSKLIHFESFSNVLNFDNNAENYTYYANYYTLNKILAVLLKPERIPDITPSEFWCFGYRFKALPDLSTDEILIT